MENIYIYKKLEFWLKKYIIFFKKIKSLKPYFTFF
jgi:hypothetical protein